MKIGELIVITGIVGTLAGGASMFLGSGCMTGEATQNRSEDNARTYARKMGIDFKGINCSTTDSDMDGYVSCDIATKSDAILRIECQLWTRGCKAKAQGGVANQ